MSGRESMSSANDRRASVEDRLSDISLNDDPPPFSPSFSRNGFLSPTREHFEDVDIGATIPLPLSPVVSNSGQYEPQARHGRLLTRSPSPSPTPRRVSTQDSIDLPPSPSRRPSSHSVHPRISDQAQLAGSTPSSPTLTASLVPRFINFKPELPSDAINLEVDDAGVDLNAPFENISLEETQPLPPLPSSPDDVETQHERRSSHASTRSASQSHPSHSSPSISASIRQGNGSQSDINGASGSQAGPSTPRRHAPPAHPHPFPIPDPSEPVSSPSNSQSPSSGSTPATTVPPPSAAPVALGVKGASMLDKVISHTRPSWLPPKDKVEDETHYHQWEEMMAHARELEKERKKQAELRRVEREKRLAQNMGRWEALMSKDFNPETIRKDPTLRELWFEGIPSHLRGKAWSLAIGNPLAMSKESYKSYLARARRSVEAGRFPQDILEQMEKDMDATLPTLRLYVRGSPMRDDLREFVCAWVVYRSDEGLAYAPYITHLAAMFLLNSPPSQAFLSLVNLLSRPCLRAFYTQTQDEIDAYYRVFENLQADLFPKIFANCKNLGLKLPESYFRSIFIEQVPFETCCRLWDQIMLDGDGYIFRAALAIFGFLEPRLHYPDKDEIASVLEGRNKATQAILERERARAKLKGEAYDEAIDGTLSVFGLNEGELFEWLSDDGWKESRFERLVTREMPD